MGATKFHPARQVVHDPKLNEFLIHRLSRGAEQGKDICIGMIPLTNQKKTVGYQVIYSNEEANGFCKYQGAKVPRLAYLSGKEILQYLKDKSKQPVEKPAVPKEQVEVQAELKPLPADPKHELVILREIPGTVHQLIRQDGKSLGDLAKRGIQPPPGFERRKAGK